MNQQLVSNPAMALALAGFSFMLTVIWGPPFLRVLRYFKIGELIRVEGPQRHFSKMGTPTMGGVLILLPVVLVTILLNFASFIGFTGIVGKSVLLPLGTMAAFLFLGAWDDLDKLRAKRVRGEGMRPRNKFLLQVVLSLLIAYGLYGVLDVPQLFLPGFQFEFDLGIWYIPVAAFIIISCANGVNFTDGLDGLAGLISATAFAAYGVVALLQDQVFLSRFCFTLVGALFGFLWFNVHPAQLFMGDTGSMPLGATLAVVALMTAQWALLPVIAIIPVSEVISVIIQVGYFKLTHGRRFFKMTPIHNHFVISGWSETQIVQRFWLIGLLAGIVGIALALV
jgi:phospho-N-acetylmuramoyl-pentapeptide-transferase